MCCVTVIAFSDLATIVASFVTLMCLKYIIFLWRSVADRL